jgi:hypothetical protein
MSTGDWYELYGAGSTIRAVHVTSSQPKLFNAVFVSGQIEGKVEAFVEQFGIAETARVCMSCSKGKEFIHYNMPNDVLEALLDKWRKKHKAAHLKHWTTAFHKVPT